jgi:hypothetical protein
VILARKPRREVEAALDGVYKYRARKSDCDNCKLRDQRRPGNAARKVLRSIHEGSRNLALDLSLTDAYVTEDASGRRSRCSSPASSASSSSIAFAYEVPAEQKTSSSSPPQPTTCAARQADPDKRTGHDRVRPIDSARLHLEPLPTRSTKRLLQHNPPMSAIHEGTADYLETGLGSAADLM